MEKMQNNLYMCRSEALRAYGKGYIVMMADCLENARLEATRLGIAYYNDTYSYRGTTDPDDVAHYQAFINTLIIDVATEPVLLRSGIFIEGSE